MSIVQVGMIGLIGVLLAIQLKSLKTELWIYICVSVGLVIFGSMLKHLEVLVETIREISSMVNVEMTYMGTLIKMIGITYVAEFSSGLCKDAGFQNIASQIEMFGKITILILSMPILLALLHTIREFLS